MIRKDVNDALNNLKKESPKQPEEKRTKSKFDDMSPDELLNAINSSKDKNSVHSVKKLKRIPPNVQKKIPEPKKNPDKKKRIVIGELPDYEELEQQETEISGEEIRQADISEEINKPADVPEQTSKEKSENKRGFFSRVKDLMYVSAEDDEENSDVISEEPEVKEVPEDDGKFTVEEIEQSTADTLESISEALAEINDGVEEKEPVQKNEPEKIPEKKPENNSSRKKKNKKKKNSGNKPSENKSVSKPEIRPEEIKSETKPAEVKPEEKKSETRPEEIKSETRPETRPEEKKSGNSGKNNKKKQKSSSGAEKKSENKDVKKDTENKSETEKSGKEEQTVPDNSNNSKPDEKIKETVSEHSQKAEKVSAEAMTKNGKYNILGLICIILAIVGVIAIISTCISNIGGSKSSKEKFAKAVYPAVIMDINSFENPSELPNDQILSASIWSVIIDNKKLSRYDERMGVVIIPAVDVENFAVELFGEDIPELTHTTVGPVESKFYYNEEAQSYNIQVKPDTFTYSPEVTSVSKEDGNYIVDVEYVEEHPEWMDKSVSKSVEFSLSKNNSGGYRINSMKILSESPYMT